MFISIWTQNLENWTDHYQARSQPDRLEGETNQELERLPVKVPICSHEALSWNITSKFRGLGAKPPSRGRPMGSKVLKRSI